ncbi:hypothetical protein KOM00_07245 [Geomonas sp. Red69]|uniref:Uncharacterized protein n=1 Tax=Geomonas diazotrophica TaxID=2843197 RepID=A0ABX8JQR7_9BACT|nr:MULTISPECIES: hypothetical protein [Geomonas]MBU5636530.1 hypothetical protein [Geomonas diazotrophica]QWV98967.1 hypothetical protein KP005_06720 [Geomonas nitrogeniifigens]QXE88133.1 hypothetical protein KP003_06970 [Geomonas nitrogeniifigens]
MKRNVSTIALGMFLTLASTAMAEKPVLGPCGTNGPLGSVDISPSSYSYTRTSVDQLTASFTVLSPSINVTGSCDPSLDYVYGNGDSGADIDVEVRVADVYNGDGSTPSLTEDQLNALKNAFSFTPSTFTLLDPGKGSQPVILTFTNTSDVPAGEYIVNIQAKLTNPETEKGLGIGPANRTFTVNIAEPQQVKLDTLPPLVTISSPGNGTSLLLNAPLQASFKAVDPTEEGAGTGVHAARAFINSCAEAVQHDVTAALSSNSLLPVAAGQEVTLTENAIANQIGTFTLVAEADDAATPAIHTGSDVRSFTVGVGVTALPPISVTGKQFNPTADVAIKWAITDNAGALLPPFADIMAVVKLPSGQVAATYVAGAIRWELDAAGNASQYIANYKIPSITGTYKVEIFVNDVCNAPVKQGELSFYVATPGAQKK